MFKGIPPIEPNAEQREGAQQCAGIFNAYVEVGFKRHEALDLLKFMIHENGQST